MDALLSGEPFAAYDPAARRAPWRAFAREARAQDEPEVVALHATREGLDEAAAAAHVRGWLGSPHDDLLVVEHRGVVRGFGRSTWRDLSGTDDADATGWHLTGVVVAPDARRRGVGLALARGVVERLVGRADRVWSVVNAGNQASLDLHLRVGFEEVRRAPTLTGVTFRGGLGVLLRCDLDDVR